MRLYASLTPALRQRNSQLRASVIASFAPATTLAFIIKKNSFIDSGYLNRTDKESQDRYFPSTRRRLPCLYCEPGQPIKNF